MTSCVLRVTDSVACRLIPHRRPSMRLAAELSELPPHDSNLLQQNAILCQQRPRLLLLML